ncbi:MAG: NAD-dependent epimerase/dehydratase family protein, partial [Desulfobacterales bacterium]|nr:NAD-dependent epimerase/dehydratase family protein [Desulfobacterales bacterium]
TGFIGPHLIQRLVAEGHNCRCLVRNSSNLGVIEEMGVELIEGDITRAHTLTGIADGIDRVLHLATLGHMSNYTVTESMFEAINVQGALNIMKEALRARVPRVVHCSTVAAMGICPEVPATEQSNCNPHHPYGRSKFKAEKRILAMAADDELPVAIIRFSMVYGPGDPRDILKLTRMTKKGLFPKIGNRPKLTPLIHVDDAVQGLLLAAEKGKTGQIYLLTNQESLPFDDIRIILQQALGIRRLPFYVPESVALAMAAFAEKFFPLIGKIPPVSRKNIESTLADRVFSIDKAKKEFGFSPQVDPKVGLKETVKWYKEQGWV